MNLQDHIEYIRNRCIDAIAHGDEMNSAIFEDGHGLIMTFNEAIEIVNHIDRLKAQREQLEKEKAELLEALKKIAEIVPIVDKIPLHEYKPEEDYAYLLRGHRIAKTAIENAEKK